MTNAIDIIRLIGCIILTVLGLCCLVTGVVGVFRFKYALNRIHSAALLDTMSRRVSQQLSELQAAVAGSRATLQAAAVTIAAIESGDAE